jgi:hypothetical protein
LEDNPLRAKRRTRELGSMSPEMRRMEEQCVPTLPAYAPTTDHVPRFLPFNFRNMDVEHSHGSSSEVTAVPHRPLTPATPVIDRGFESMIDHKSIINQRIDTPVGRRQGERNSDETHALTPLPSPLLNGTSTSTERTDAPRGELNAPSFDPSRLSQTDPSLHF